MKSKKKTTTYYNGHRRLYILSANLSKGVKSLHFGGHLTSPLIEIIEQLNFYFNN